VLGQLPEITDPNVIVGTANADDAGVYRISDDMAAVLTADFFTPIVDDPYAFGAIAASNALSDVWAMGGRALAALNISMFPSEASFLPILQQIIKGGSDKMAEAGVPIIGGHTIKDKEPKYGFCILGLIHPNKIFDNSMARPGDSMVLTKKLGTGIISTGIKEDKHDPAVVDEFIASMALLNRRAAELMIEHGAHTCTDITGFGLIGHMHEVLKASNLRAEVRASSVPVFEEALRLAGMNIIPGGTRDNFNIFSDLIELKQGVDRFRSILLVDAQTSGGLLIFISPDKREGLLDALNSEGIIASYIGDTFPTEKNVKQIIVHP
jgi:selenide,water dikinase